MAIAHSAHSSKALFSTFLPVLDLLAEVKRRKTIRKVYGAMSCAQLRDVGLTPHDLVLALALPLERDADQALARAAAVEASRW